MSCVAGAVTESHLWTVEASQGVLALDISCDNPRLAVARDDGAVLIVDAVTAATLLQLQVGSEAVLFTRWSPTSDLLATATADGRIAVWRADNGDRLAEYETGNTWIEAMQWSPDGKYLAVASGKSLHIWNAQGKCVFVYERHASSVTAIDWHPDSRKILTSSYRGVAVFDVLYPNKPPVKLACPDSLITAAWNTDGKYISAGSQDRRVHVWKYKGGKSRHFEMSGYPSKVCACDWASHSPKLATAGGNNIVVWDVTGEGPAGRKPAVIKWHKRRVTGLYYQPRGKLLASTATDGEVCVWGDDGNKALLLRFRMTDETTAFCWSSGGEAIYVADRQGHMRAYSVT